MPKQQTSLSTCILGMPPLVASNLPPFTSRRAFDSSGRLGLFYNAYCDRVVSQSNLNFNLLSVPSQRSGNCYIITDKIEESSNLLKVYNIHHELRLSVALHMGQEMGVGALVNYSRPTNKYTRLISYTSYSGTDYLSNDEFNWKSTHKIASTDILATHVIVLVNWGIDAVAVVQLPPDDQRIETFDLALKKICICLSNNPTGVILTHNDQCLLEQIVHTEVFSNIPELRKISSILDFHRTIPQIKNDTNLIKPYNYNLCPIETFYIMNNNMQSIFKELEIEHGLLIEGYLLCLSRHFRILEKAINHSYPTIQQHLKERFFEVHGRWLALGKMHTDEIQRVKELVIGVRRGEIEQIVIPEELNNNNKEELQRNINNFINDWNAMRNKELLIGNLIEKHFEYRNVVEYGVTDRDDEKALVSKLSVDGNYYRLICFHDNLRTNKKKEWDQLNTQVIKQQKENPQLRFIYVDFSYSSYDLTNFIILPMVKTENNTPVPKSISPSTSSKPPQNDDTINILLLGESGVGKSTFINAFVNYLLFDTFDQAKHKSVVLIPVSFLMTTGDDFQERTVTFGGMDTMNNEDHDSPGQSVTQHCKSYLFTLKGEKNKGQKLRIIDTPGIGDVRGLAQDDINMQHILSYINNLTHLNAVCILMKPNNARLNILFPACFMQLFDLLGEHVSEKIIFCFTNSRSTFYTPGNTAPLLKTLLQSLPGKGICFSKKNTFCVDSKSFRYLVAIQNGIKFSESEEAEYEDSWQKSANESKRFLEYIQTELIAPLAPSETKSVKNAQLKITMMIRPLLESMHNILRNIVFCKVGRSSILMELCSRNIKHPTAICASCPRQYVQVEDLWIKVDVLHFFYNKCRTCECSPQEHYPIDYELGYQLFNYPASYSDVELTMMLDDLCQMSAAFSHFLVGITETTAHDVFLAGIERMIKEEDDICGCKESCQLNLKLCDCLKELKKKYEEARVKPLADKQEIPLSAVYVKIEEMLKYDMIKSQILAAKEWHKFMIKYYEIEVPI